MRRAASVTTTILFAALIAALVLSGLIVLAGVLAYAPLRWLAKWGPVYRLLFRWRMRRSDRCRAGDLCSFCQLAESQPTGKRSR